MSGESGDDRRWSRGFERGNRRIWGSSGVFDFETVVSRSATGISDGQPGARASITEIRAEGWESRQ